MATPETAVTIPGAAAPESREAGPAALEAAPAASAGAASAAGAAPAAVAPEVSAALRAWLGTHADRLAGKAMEFNRYPLRYAHPSWIPEGWGPWAARMAGQDRAEAGLGRGLFEVWGLDGRPCFDFAPAARRLALLDAALLRRTVMLAGLARLAGEISRLVERSRVLELKEQVGEVAYRFVTQRAPLLAGPLTEGANAASRGTDWRERAMAAGLGMLGACLGTEHAGVAARAALKFPRVYSSYLGAGGGQGTNEGYLRLFRRVLAKEVDPTWDALLS